MSSSWSELVGDAVADSGCSGDWGRCSMFPPPSPNPSWALSSEWSMVVSWLDPSRPWLTSPSGTSMVTGEELLNWELIGCPRSWGWKEKADKNKRLWEKTSTVWKVLDPSPSPVTSPTKCFLLIGWWLPDSCVPAPARRRWRKWRRMTDRPLPPRRSRVPPRCPRARCPTARQNGTPHRTRGPSLGPKRWGGSRTLHHQGWGCEMSGKLEESIQIKVRAVWNKNTLLFKTNNKKIFDSLLFAQVGLFGESLITDLTLPATPQQLKEPC